METRSLREKPHQEGKVFVFLLHTPTPSVIMYITGSPIKETRC